MTANCSSPSFLAALGVGSLLLAAFPSYALSDTGKGAADGKPQVFNFGNKSNKQTSKSNDPGTSKAESSSDHVAASKGDDPAANLSGPALALYKKMMKAASERNSGDPTAALPSPSDVAARARAESSQSTDASSAGDRYARNPPQPQANSNSTSDDNASLRQEVAALQAQLHQSAPRHATYRRSDSDGSIEDLQSQIDHLVRMQHVAERDRDRLYREIQQNEQRRVDYETKLQHALVTASKNIDSQQNIVGQLSAQLAEVAAAPQGISEDLKKRLHNMKSLVGHLKTGMSDLAHKTKSLQQSNAKLAANQKKLSNSNAQLGTQVASLSKTTSQVTTQVASLDKKTSSIDDKVGSIRAETSKMGIKIAGLDKKATQIASATNGLSDDIQNVLAIGQYNYQAALRQIAQVQNDVHQTYALQMASDPNVKLGFSTPYSALALARMGGWVRPQYQHNLMGDSLTQDMVVSTNLAPLVHGGLNRVPFSSAM